MRSLLLLILAASCLPACFKGNSNPTKPSYYRWVRTQDQSIVHAPGKDSVSTLVLDGHGSFDTYFNNTLLSSGHYKQDLTRLRLSFDAVPLLTPDLSLCVECSIELNADTLVVYPVTGNLHYSTTYFDGFTP